MRIPSHLLTAIEKELEHSHSKLGSAFLDDYAVALERWDANINDQQRQDYLPKMMDKVEELGKRLQRWYSSVIQDREETAKRKKR